MCLHAIFNTGPLTYGLNFSNNAIALVLKDIVDIWHTIMCYMWIYNVL